MNLRRKVAELDLVFVLLAIAALELALNRLAVPVLRPPGVHAPPWHKNADTVGLFVFHLTTALAFAVSAWKTVDLFGRPGRFRAGPRVLGLVAAVVFLGLAAWSTVAAAPQTLSFHLESCFTLLLIVLGMALALQPGDPLIKIGLILLTVPFLLHYYGTFALRLLLGTEAHGSNLPDRMREIGQWSVALAALGVSLCFAPRPLASALARPGPAAIAGFIGTILTVIMVRYEDVGLELASKGLGIDFGPGAPPPIIGAFVLAAMAIAWTLASSLTAPDAARRHLGSGLALICIGGYAFTWPLTLLTVAAGALVIVEAGTRLAPPLAVDTEVRATPLPQPALRGYLEALAGEIGGIVEEAGEIVTLRGAAFAVRVDRRAPVVTMSFGAVPEGAEPVWTLETRPERILRGTPHAPFTSAPTVRTGDAAFDLRFRLHDTGALSGRILDDGLRARAAAILDGWVAIWDGGALRYQVVPGRGAPLDHPLPVTALRRGDATDPRRLAAVFELLAEIQRRAETA